MKIGKHELGVCSWSLQPSGMADLAAKLARLGLSRIQLAMAELVALEPAAREAELATLKRANIAIASGMVAFPGEDYSTIDAIRRTGGFVPDDAWSSRRTLARQTAELARSLAVKSVSTHVGFVPHEPGVQRTKMLERVQRVADDFAELKIDLLLESGQETAEGLVRFLDDLKRPNVFVNFDPANMILYGDGDPIGAIALLGKRIFQCHAKDATASSAPRVEWGAEVPFGAGEVGPARFLRALDEAGFSGGLMIEREAGSDRMGDVATAIKSLQAAAGS